MKVLAIFIASDRSLLNSQTNPPAVLNDFSVPGDVYSFISNPEDDIRSSIFSLVSAPVVNDNAVEDLT